MLHRQYNVDSVVGEDRERERRGPLRSDSYEKIIDGLLTIPRCNVSGVRCFTADMPQGGLEVPCTYDYSLD